MISFTKAEPREEYIFVGSKSKPKWIPSGEFVPRVQCVDPETGMTFRCDDTVEARESLLAKIEKVRKASAPDHKTRRTNFTRRPPYSWTVCEKFVRDGELENAREYADLYGLFVPLDILDGKPVVPKSIVEPRVFLTRYGDAYAINSVGDKARSLKSGVKTVQAARAVCHDNRAILDEWLANN